MIALDLAEICRHTGGRLAPGTSGDLQVTGPVVVDSRRCEPGALFVCLPGEHADGHDFAAAAIAAGATAVVATRDVGVPAVIVDDAERALGALAAGVLTAAPQCTVVGVTGSSGKTSTKDLLAQVFDRFGPTVAPESSFNNEIGLPLTVLRIDEQTRTLVCEYSARGPGHIRHLCAIAPPAIGIVLNIGVAHLGEFGSRESIAAAKGELVEAVPASGVAVLNADDELTLGLRSRTEATVMTFGESPAADVRIVDLTLDDQARAGFRLVTADAEARVDLSLYGAHHASNAAATAAAALAAGLDLATVADALSRAGVRSAHRMAVHRRDDGLVVIDDAYNANPESTEAALDALASLHCTGRRWAVLGEMRELGASAGAMHHAVGAHAATIGIDELLGVGRDELAAGAQAVPGWSGRARAVPDADAATRILRTEARAEDVVLVKASNSLRLWRVAEALLAALPTGATA